MPGVNELFGPTGHVTWLQECARSVVIFACGLALVRIAGRRAFARWSALDIVVAIIVGSSLSRAQTGNAPLIGTIVRTAVLMLLHWLFARGSTLSPFLSTLIEGRPVRLGQGGALNPTELLKHNVSDSALFEALRQSGVEEPAQARCVMLEPSGKITVLR